MPCAIGGQRCDRDPAFEQHQRSARPRGFGGARGVLESPTSRGAGRRALALALAAQGAYIRRAVLVGSRWGDRARPRVRASGLDPTLRGDDFSLQLRGDRIYAPYGFESPRASNSNTSCSRGVSSATPGGCAIQRHRPWAARDVADRAAADKGSVLWLLGAFRRRPVLVGEVDRHALAEELGELAVGFPFRRP